MMNTVPVPPLQQKAKHKKSWDKKRKRKSWIYFCICIFQRIVFFNFNFIFIFFSSQKWKKSFVIFISRKVKCDFFLIIRHSATSYSSSFFYLLSHSLFLFLSFFCVEDSYLYIPQLNVYKYNFDLNIIFLIFFILNKSV